MRGRGREREGEGAWRGSDGGKERRGVNIKQLAPQSGCQGNLDTRTARTHHTRTYPYTTIESGLLSKLDNEILPEWHGENAAEEHHDDDVLEVVS